MSNLLNLSIDQAMAAFGGAEPPKAYRFYNGEVTIYYDDAEHSYTRYDDTGLVIIPGASTAVGIVEKPALMPWVAKMTVGYLRDNFDLTKQYTAEEFEDVLYKAKRAYKDYVQAAADTGSIAHDAIEQHIKVQLGLRTAPVELPTDPRALNGYFAALDWFDKHSVRFVCTERKVYSREHDFAGTLDALGYVSSCGDINCCGVWVEQNGVAVRVPTVFDGVLATIDHKTSNGLWAEYAYQTALYTLAQNEEHGYGIQHRFVNRLDKDDASFESWYLGPERLELDTRIGLQCVQLYRSIEQRKAADKAESEIIAARRQAERARAKAEKEKAKQDEKVAKAEARLKAKQDKEQAKLDRAAARLAKKEGKEAA